MAAVDAEKTEFLATVQMEIDLYRKYSACYWNVFYMMEHE